MASDQSEVCPKFRAAEIPVFIASPNTPWDDEGSMGSYALRLGFAVFFFRPELTPNWLLVLAREKYKRICSHQVSLRLPLLFPSLACLLLPNGASVVVLDILAARSAILLGSARTRTIGTPNACPELQRKTRAIPISCCGINASAVGSTTAKTSTTTTSSKTTSTTSMKTTSTTTSKSSTTTSKATTTTTTTSAAATTTSSTRQKFKYFGVNESSAEFGNTAWPGILGTDYTWPTTTSVDYFLGKGFNTFRIAFLMERISPPATGLTGAFDATYLAGLKTIASYITSKGGYAILDPHNFMRYNNAVISDNTAFATWWKNLSAQFASDDHIIFDLQNEPHDIAAATVASSMQAAVNSIRAGGATKQLILVEGTSYTGAWTWTTGSGNSDAFATITDPNNNIAIEMHQYLDSDGSGTDPTCVSSTIGVERITAATAWLTAHNFKGFLGELGAGSNDNCIAAIKGALTLMQQPGSPWIGALWWAAGPWWGTYYQSIEPPSGPAIARILPEALVPFL